MCGQRVVISVLFLASCPSLSYASTAIAVVTPEGIVLGADTKSVDRCDAPCPHVTESPNLVFVQDGVAMGTAGLFTVLGNSHVVAPYSFPSFVGLIRTRLQPNATLSHVAAIVETETGRVFSWFDSYLRLGLLKQNDFPGDYPVEYLIAGYEDHAPAIYRIYLEVDWRQRHLKGVHRVLTHPKTSDKDFGIYGVGSNRLLQQILVRRGDLYRKLRSKVPIESRLLLDKHDLSLKQAAAVVRAVLDLEASANPNHVGAPFSIVALPKDGRRR